MSNNKIADWGELDKLASLPELREVLFLGASQDSAAYECVGPRATPAQLFFPIPLTTPFHSAMPYLSPSATQATPSTTVWTR
jgi:hypothetical protein